MSIAKAALIVYYETIIPEWPDGWIYTGDLSYIHEIVRIAGAKQCSFHTTHQVLSCLNNSPFWKSDGVTTGWQGKRANCYKPSEKGLEYYKMALKETLIN